MKWDRMIRNVLASTGAFLTSFAMAAGLDISDTPLYVTQPLAPNVIISPVFSSESNEVSFRTVPDRYSSCTTEDISNLALPCDIWNYWYHGAPFYVEKLRIYNWRVTPWPDVKLANEYKDVHSDVALYPHDITAFDDRKVFMPLDYSDPVNSFPRSDTSFPEDQVQYTQSMTEEPYPESVSDYPMRYAKAIFARSDLNFLYFNKRLADDARHGYAPWPSLGKYSAFPVYSDASAAASPYYHPSSAHDHQADLGSTLRYLTRQCDPTKPRLKSSSKSADPRDCYWLQLSTVEQQALIGQYWTYDGKGEVWEPSSYKKTSWSEMSEADKIKFAHWFTYWRSSDLTTRGMLGRLIDELGKDKKDMLSRMRLGIFHGKMTASGEVSKQVGLLVGDTESDTVAALADAIYDSKTVFVDKRTHTLTVKEYGGVIRTEKLYDTYPIWDPYDTLAYFKTEAPYREDPRVDTSSANPVRSCRRNYEIVLTPDYSGLRTLIGAPRSMSSKPEGEDGNYDKLLGAPYSDTYADTFGDVGAYGWMTDLMPKLENNLLETKYNKQTAQHLVRYVIGPKQYGLIFNKDLSTYAEALQHLADSDIGWYDVLLHQLPYGAPKALNPRAAIIDEFWHMSLNSRGFFYSGENVGDALDKLLASLNDILVNNVSGSSIATSTTFLSAGELTYQATVESDWKGHLRAYKVSESLNADSKEIITIDYENPKWNFAEKLSDDVWSSRKIATYDPAKGRGVAFGWDSINSDMQGYLKLDPPSGVAATEYGSKVLEYLRGSGECEDGSKETCSSEGVNYVFRRRNLERNNLSAYSSKNPAGRNLLGDIANSSPWLVGPPVAGPSDVDYPGYNDFRVANKSRQKVVYVGANDGMLHAVNADDGDELFAYIPYFVSEHLHELSRVSYGHKYYVDGSPFSANVYVGGEWKTYLAGGANKGGQGYYLLDVTDPTSNTEANADKWVKWEFTADDDADMHYTFNLPAADAFGQARQFVRIKESRTAKDKDDKPETVKVNKWALLVGNGYPEESGKRACLFIIYLDGPAGESKKWVENKDYFKLCAGETDYSSDGGRDTNGLSTPTPFDSDGDGWVDVVYAGDLNGNLWRFDLSDPDAKQWKVAYEGKPVFVARPVTKVDGVDVPGNRQAIISPPEVKTLLVGSQVGQLLLFGTGKYIEPSDITDQSTQTFYGVWDRGLSGITRSNLIEQKLDEPTSAGDLVVRKQSTKVAPTYCSTAVDEASGCTSAKKHLGWYWDMPIVGERLTGKINLIDHMVFFNTFYPSTEKYVEGEGDDAVTKYRLDPCEYGGEGWLMGLDAVNGYMEDRLSVFDVNQDGVVDDTSDVKVAGVRIGASMGGTSFAHGLKDTMVGLYAPTNKALTNKDDKAVVRIGDVTGRVTWFELMD